MDIAVLVYYTHSTGSLYTSTVLMGFGHRIQRSPDIVVRRRNNRTETQGIDGFVGVYIVYAWSVVDLHFGIFIRMENLRIAEYTLSDHVHMPCDFHSRVSSVAGFLSEK
ncbi:unnamed protein product [Macrosiphum euphorbiae]|uniref:Uncharacterized protein n=1 Tax=Macrosiphum euphorbiae TaxID=13131 RepID=A0AAV0XYP1_9HEMI|nr:unnamed protein product [Macrosiphum euphorbiae]